LIYFVSINPFLLIKKKVRFAFIAYHIQPNYFATLIEDEDWGFIVDLLFPITNRGELLCFAK